MLDTALKQIATMQPAQLPEVELPRVPDLSAAEPLAAIAHGNPAPLLESAKSIDLDNATISAALGQARTLVAGTIRDLVGIATQLVRRALPTALGFLSLDPSARAAAMAKLRALVSQHLGMATARVQRLMGDLSAAAQSLHPVAQRPVRSALADAPVHPTISQNPTALPEQSAVGAGADATANEAHSASPTPEPSAEGGSAAGQAAVAAAKSQVGQPYVWGGTGNGGFDCSGLTQWAYSQAGVDLPRTADQQAVGQQVSADQLQPGDLVVWDGHVAMYSGNGEIVEAGDPVQTNPLRTTNMGMQFKGFWRPTA
ncbi:C40 family peptidase [Corynebacterium tuberculostearicum]|uniref:C40 family peptidase n=1 Tax=Corynebacterium tuberculostearicum TaxID=38304 RepID=UPI0019563A0F|nr:C40 family peptidase [Corynebacterium tuberculostearicum]QRQ67192.1 C40 family peptidase [Corynebacterium tuberculostearicum]WKE55948.1 C40 family peptidase [Corynebacterium tuberculostearicum]